MTNKLNFWINVAIYVMMGVMLFSGFLMKFTMPPGTGGKLTLLGFDRHGWGVLHFWVAVALLIGVVLHLWLHWAWVRTTTKQYWLRAAVPSIAVLLILTLAAIAAPLLLRPVEVPGGGEGSGIVREASSPALVEQAVEAKLPADPAAVPADPCQSCASAPSCVEGGETGKTKDGNASAPPAKGEGA
jgi:hypothetical protein